MHLFFSNVQSSKYCFPQDEKKVEAKHFNYKLSLFAYTPKMDFIYVMAFRSTVLSAGERTSIKKHADRTLLV